LYDIKTIKRGIYIDESQVPAVRVDIVMDCIPKELQKDIETNLDEFCEKMKGIVEVATKTMPPYLGYPPSVVHS
jgi:hypothetical protein